MGSCLLGFIQTFFKIFALRCRPCEQLAYQDSEVRVSAVRGQEGTVPWPFSQLHPLHPIAGHGLHHLRVHEAGPPPELVFSWTRRLRQTHRSAAALSWYVL